MSKKTSKRQVARKARHSRVRRKVSGTAACPRLAVFRSAKHIYVQAINDENGTTIASASTVDKDLKADMAGKSGNVEAAGVVGKAIAGKLLKSDIKDVVFDRGGFLYTGRVKALAEQAREGGLQF